MIYYGHRSVDENMASTTVDQYALSRHSVLPTKEVDEDFLLVRSIPTT